MRIIGSLYSLHLDLRHTIEAIGLPKAGLQGEIHLAWTIKKAETQTRWMGVALLRAQEGFRRVRGHEELGDVAAALERAGSGALSLRCSSAPPALSSAGEHCELATEIGFYHRVSIGQPAEILTI